MQQALTIGRELTIVDDAALSAASSRTLTHSELSLAMTGAPSVSEASALAAAGPASRLLGASAGRGLGHMRHRGFGNQPCNRLYPHSVIASRCHLSPTPLGERKGAWAVDPAPFLSLTKWGRGGTAKR